MVSKQKEGGNGKVRHCTRGTPTTPQQPHPSCAFSISAFSFSFLSSILFSCNNAMVSCHDLRDAGVPDQKMRVCCTCVVVPSSLAPTGLNMEIHTFLYDIANFTSLPCSAESRGGAFLRILRVDTGGSDYAPLCS